MGVRPAFVPALLLTVLLWVPLLSADADAPEPVVLDLGCSDAYAYTAMEWSLSRGTCWMHGGHHTYDLGRQFVLAGGTGQVFSVEQQFSPPTEFTDPPFDTPVVVEVGTDGRTWTTIGFATYQFTNLPGQGSPLALRQRIDFTLDAHDDPFRYLRVRQPFSAAQGLSGFLDWSVLELHAVPHDVPGAVVARGGRFTYTCDADIMEDVFATHPCWFGGLNRYDAASFSHTYVLGGNATITSLDGAAQILPWRTDDFFIPIPPPVDQAVRTQLIVETSADSETWTEAGRVPVLAWGVPNPFSFAFDEPVAAQYVRVHSDWHPRYDQAASSPALHHLEGFVTDSELAFNGELVG